MLSGCSLSLRQVSDTKFGTYVSIKKFMNIDKLQCYSYFKSEVIEGDESFIRDFNKA